MDRWDIESAFCRPALANDDVFACLGLLHSTTTSELGKGSICRVREQAGYVVKTIDVEDPVILKRACIEAHVAKQLNHELFPVYVACIPDRDAKQMHLIMQASWPNARHLLHTVRARGPLPEASVRTIIRQLVAALDHLHTCHGLVYADVKAENVLHRAEDDRIHLIDFDLCMPLPGATQYQQVSIPSSSAPTAARGALSFLSTTPQGSNGTSSRQVPESSRGARPPVVVPLPKHLWLTAQQASDSFGEPANQENEPHFWGTLEYVAPEVVDHGKSANSACSDWWSVGVLTYELLYGHTPFRAINQERTLCNIRSEAVWHVSFQHSICTSGGHSRLLQWMGQSKLQNPYAARVPIACRMRAPVFPDEPKVSHRCHDLIRSMLRHRPEYRLGHKGVQEILSHPWFSKPLEQP